MLLAVGIMTYHGTIALPEEQGYHQVQNLDRKGQPSIPKLWSLVDTYHIITIM
jgi:hypothetical protein